MITAINAISVTNEYSVNLALDLNFTLCENHLSVSVIYCAFMYTVFVYIQHTVMCMSIKTAGTRRINIECTSNEYSVRDWGHIVATRSHPNERVHSIVINYPNWQLVARHHEVSEMKNTALNRWSWKAKSDFIIVDKSGKCLDKIYIYSI